MPGTLESAKYTLATANNVNCKSIGGKGRCDIRYESVREDIPDAGKQTNGRCQWVHTLSAA